MFPAKPDYLGAFALTAGPAPTSGQALQEQHDDHSAIMVKALADRLAEAFAELLHERARQDGDMARRRNCRRTN